MVSLCRKLMDVDKEYVLSKQLLKSSTSIGANIEEAIGGSPEMTLNTRFPFLIRKHAKRNIGFGY